MDTTRWILSASLESGDLHFAAYLGVPPSVRDKVYAEFSQKSSNAIALIDVSFLPGEYKTLYKDLFSSNYRRIDLVSNWLYPIGYKIDIFIDYYTLSGIFMLLNHRKTNSL